MDLTGIFVWLNDFASWIGGFFHWLGLEVQAVVATCILMAKDGLMRLTVWAGSWMIGQLGSLGLPSVNFSTTITDLGASAADFFLAAGLPSALATVMGVVLFKWILRLIPLPWRA